MNSSKSSLFLMELILSILFFSLASAVCVQLFVKSHLINRQSTDMTNAVNLSQDVAEIYTTDNKLKKELGEIVIYTAKGDQDEKIIFSVMKVIGMIHKIQPDIIVENIGEADFIVEFRLPNPPNKIWKYTRKR